MWIKGNVRLWVTHAAEFLFGVKLQRSAARLHGFSVSLTEVSDKQMQFVKTPVRGIHLCLNTVFPLGFK